MQPQTPNVFAQPPKPDSLNTPPIWAASQFDDVKSIKLAIPKIEKIEQTVNNIKEKLSAVESRVNSLETKMTEVEIACSFMSSEHDTQKNDLKQAREQIKGLEKNCKKLDIH